MKSRSILNTIDVLGPQIGLRVNKDEVFKSKIGGFFTIMVAFISVGVFFGFGRDLFSRKSPSVMVNKLINPNPSYQISYLNILFAIYDQASDKVFEELDRKFYSYLDYYVWKGDGTRTAKRIYLERCGEETIQKWDGYFKSPKSNYLCLPESTFLNITGIYNEGQYTSSRLQVDFCKNNTDAASGPIKTDCYSRSFIEKNITGRIQMHYMLESSKIDNVNYTSPGSTAVISDTTNTNTNSWNRLKILFKNIEIKTDQGFLVDDWESLVFNSVDAIFTETVYTLGTNTIFSHILGNAKYMDVYTRNYIKIQNIFALMGGFINAAMILLRICVKYLCYPKLIDIFNVVYKYKSVTEMKQIEKSPIDCSGMYTKSMNDERVCSSKLINNYTAKTPNASSLRNLWREKEKKNYMVHIRALAKLCMPCYSQNKHNRKKIKYFNLIQSKFEQVLSVEKFFKLSREVKFYKYFFLNDFQKKLLKVCPIPNKKKIDDPMIFETKFSSVLENIKSDSNELNARVLDYFMNSKD